jgi:hypothetical protein
MPRSGRAEATGGTEAEVNGSFNLTIGKTLEIVVIGRFLSELILQLTRSLTPMSHVTNLRIWRGLG